MLPQACLTTTMTAGRPAIRARIDRTITMDGQPRTSLADTIPHVGWNLRSYAITRHHVRLIAGCADRDTASMVTHVNVERLDFWNNGVFSAGVDGLSGSYATR
jgi:hypothetical protein